MLRLTTDEAEVAQAAAGEKPVAVFCREAAVAAARRVVRREQPLAQVKAAVRVARAVVAREMARNRGRRQVAAAPDQDGAA